ncbi:ABC transporter ATP-binding protein [Pseudoduganella chitinolytica]|uniref:ABC transporter ATP-binding protein n=1 Tax=Pseudoduganella chitinolytica TaxID=34070 RepID=A0ABY8BJT3_9BURK|nr:ABC transporter ATP-binding protein [Pseudoduganella chitinolytica]WEF34942.1 ABC transporter ATP-binding protein [Pseudoduganella chitinolytica]
MSNTFNNTALELADVTVRYGAADVLQGLTLRVRRGEIYALLGGNGAGKSTTINALLGFAPLAAGRVRVCGIDVAADVLAARAALAYVPENVALYEHLSARENLAYFLRLAGAPTDGIDAALTTVGLAAEAWPRRLAGYSKGMRQKVAIALALARAVPVLLLDEPTTGLDPQATSEFNRMLQDLRGQGVTVFMVTHDLLGAAEVADRIGFLDRGRIVQELAAEGPARFDVQALYARYASTRRAA